MIKLAESMLADGFKNGESMVTVGKNAETIPGDGNGLLQTGLWYCIKASVAPLTEMDCAAIAVISNRCKHKDFPIFWRSPYKINPDDNQEHDDYWGWLAALYHSKNELACEFYKKAESWSWFIDIQEPGDHTPKYYFDRFPGFRIFAKASARNISPLTPREILEVALVGFKKCYTLENSDALMRTYCFFSVLSRESRIMKAIGALWLQRVRKKYGTTGHAFAGYFQDEKHPLCIGDWNL